ncbi:recombinase family protein [Pseudomonas veronii]|uniref:recombinase family protein n=1 Tax=Pseudomonas veronii TaxID=76761 RepID=UPI003555E085
MVWPARSYPDRAALQHGGPSLRVDWHPRGRRDAGSHALGVPAWQSTQRQYALVRRATSLGWSQQQVNIVDDDLGLSGASTARRGGFARMTAEVALGHVGIILGLEVSRLARNNADWYLTPLHRLIRFLFVRPAFCLGLPSDSQSPATPLPPANTSPCRVCRGLSPPSHQLGAPKKRPRRIPGALRGRVALVRFLDRVNGISQAIAG